MALYDIKEFLTLSDVAEYLADKCNYEFNLEYSVDQNRLIETIVQLVRNDELHPVFYYSGSMDFLEKKVITRKSGRSINHEIVSTDIAYDMSRMGHYFVNNKTFNKLIENNCSNYINIINSIVEPYHIDGKQEICENSILDYREIKEDFSIIFYDLLYPKLDLDKLFNQTDTEVIEQLRKQVTDLEAENDQLNDKLSKQEYTLTDDKELPSNSQAGVARMLYAILTEHDYDLSPPKGKGLANDLIVNASNSHGTSVTRNFVADWLIRAREAKINNTK
ncbi:hypothetical protein [Psychrobacter sp. APC 3350]|uniref:hypothetical protein n=1 Tax=Psychrobacter sp. APC 3350 TaxID=3035195 RepID=UPI0025B3EE55|nr:hypothetical protein [Psychrobacter sp. APC 3350]MDN3453479.1 hypothetical protein [Psychrobacter sp. APC 3350]